MYRDGASEEQVRARIAAQMDDEEKRRRADFTVVNDGVQLLIPQLNRIVEQLKTEKFIL
jgi:dephospho-CoA kinase